MEINQKGLGIESTIPSGLVRNITTGIALFSAVLSVLAGIFWGTQPDGIRLVAFLAALSTFLLSILAVLIYKKGRYKLAFWFSTGIACIIVLANPLVIKNMSLVVGSVTFLAASITIKKSVRTRHFLVFLASGFFLLLSSILLDIFGRQNRLDVLGSNIALSLNIFMGVTTIAVVLYYLTSYSLKARISGTLTITGIALLASLFWLDLQFSRFNLGGSVENLVLDSSAISKLMIMAGIFSVYLYVLSLRLTSELLAPIRAMTKMANQIENRDYTARVVVGSQNEVGQLAVALNSMAVQLQRDFIALEDDLKLRMLEFEQQASQLELAADIGRAAVTIHNLDDLLVNIVDLISERFDLYHVGIYLTDQSGDHVVLKAASSEGGKRMLANKHRIAFGYPDLVGYVAATGQPRAVQNAGEDSVYFSNPDLPHTQSELALPLVSSAELIGVLDFHSIKFSAFTSHNLAAMRVLSNLITVALENARLFAESKNAIEAVRRAYGEISKNAWLDYLAGGNVYSIRSQKQGTFEFPGHDEKILHSDNSSAISIPIKVRDHVIGYVDTYKSGEQGVWSSAEEEILIGLVELIGDALESARLYESSQTEAEHKRLVAEVSSHLQENLDIDAVMRKAVLSIRQALNLNEVSLVLSEEISELDGERL